MVAGLLLLALSFFSSGAAGKEFNSGDLRLCNAKRCVSIKSRPVLHALSEFYYDSAVPPARARAPRLGLPFFRLEFSNGYVTGIIAGRQFDHFLSNGVNLDQFRAGVWYRVPPRALAGLRELTFELTPMRLTGRAVAGAPTFAVNSATAPTRRAGSPAAAGHGSGVSWALGVVSLAALIGLASLASRRRRTRAAQPHTPSPR